MDYYCTCTHVQIITSNLLNMEQNMRVVFLYPLEFLTCFSNFNHATNNIQYALYCLVLILVYFVIQLEKYLFQAYIQYDNEENNQKNSKGLCEVF